MATVLLLFDIDGTLLQKAATEHAAALRAALRSVYGVTPGEGGARVEAAGRTDLEIARAILTLADVSSERIDSRLDLLRARCCSEFARRCPADLSDRVTPGMAALLDSLAAREGVELALVTGNLEPVARLKLARAGLGHHFAPGQGAYGSDSEDRTDLPPLARRRAGRDGEPYPRARTLVIGDTPRDIACARADELRCLAVATGPYGAEALTRADAVAADVPELERLLAAELD